MKFHVAHYLPDNVVSNNDLAGLYADWNSERVIEQVGVINRHYADKTQTALDLAQKASETLFTENNIDRNIVDFLVLVTQCPEYKLPATACILQNRLRLPKKCGAFDINLGCSGFVYALSVAKGLILSGNASNVLIVTTDTLSKYVNNADKSLKTLIGDAAAAFMISKDNASSVGNFIFGTDGSGYSDIIITAGGEKMPVTEQSKMIMSENVTYENLFMDGMKVFTFAITTVPPLVGEILLKNSVSRDDIDLYVFHQANKTILNYIKKKLGIPDEKFYINMTDVGNTSSSTIPLALSMAEKEGRLKAGMKVMLLGFGVGLSWCGTIIEWR